MTTNNRGRWALIIFGAAFLATSLVHLGRFVLRDRDIWWTPLSRAGTLAESADRVEVYVQGRRLDREIAAGRVLLATQNGPVPVSGGDVRARLNNDDRVAVRQLPLVASASAGALAGLLALLFGICGFTLSRSANDRGRPPGP